MSATATRATRSRRIGPLTRVGDEALAGRAASGDDAAFTALYERYHGPLLGYCRSILLDDEDAHDAAQNALENALRSLPRRAPSRPLRPWLYRIAHNEAINIVRRRRPQAVLRELDEPTVPGPEVDAEQRVRLAQLVDDLRDLPERQRGALVMRELSGLGYDEIGLTLGVSDEAARRAVFDARSALHEAVDGRATDCVNVRHCISDGDRRSLRARRMRAHLRSCDDCASFQRAIHARSADLHLLGPWFSGAAIAGVLGGGGAGGGALIAVGGGGAATATVAGWSSLPVLLKGLTVAAVVATTGTAAVEIEHVAKPAGPAPRVLAARPAPAPGPPKAAPLRAKVARALSKGSARSSRGASAQSARGTLRLRAGAGAGALISAHRETPATPTPQPARATAPARAPVPAPVAAPEQRPQTAPATSHPTVETPPQLAVQQLTDIREQILAAVQHAQTTAASGTASALQSANTTLHGTLGPLRTTIDRVLARFGLKLPAPAATPAPPSTTTPSLPNVLAPVQQILGGVDSLLSKLFEPHSR